MKRVFVATFLFASAAFAQTKEQCISTNESAQKLLDQHKLITAREQFLACAKDACPPAIKQDCSDNVRELAKKIPSIVIHAKDKHGQDVVDAKVSIDGNVVAQRLDGTAINVDPGVHVFKLEVGSDAVEQQVVVSEGVQSRPVELSFASASSPPPQLEPKKRGFPVVATIFAGVAVAGFANMTIFGLLALGDYNSAKTCGAAGCPSSKIDDIKTKQIVADISLGVGAAAAITAGILYIVHFSSSPSKEVSFSPIPGGGYGSIGMKF